MRRHPVVSVLLFVVMLAVLSTAVPLVAAALPLQGARDDASAAQDALAVGDLGTAAEHLQDAERRFRRARLLLRNPLTWVGGLVPWAGQNVRTAGALARAGELAARGAGRVATEVEDLPDGIGAFAPSGGVVPIAPLEGLARPLRAAADDLGIALELLEDSPDLLLLAPVADARAELREILLEAAPTVQAAAQLAEHLPSFLGSEEPKRYFFGATNPAELRGSGGFLGSYALLEIDDGRLSLGPFEDATDLPEVPTDEIEAPNPDYAARYNRFGGAGFWHNINLTPDFPAAANAIATLHERVTGIPVDGVILADPHALEALLRVSGPVTVPGLGQIVPDDAVAFVANEAYAEFDSDPERKRVLGAVAAGALEGLLAGPGDIDAQDLASTLARLFGEGHLLLNAADPRVQHALEFSGVAGSIADDPGDYLAVIGNNAALNKLDFYVDREVRYRAVLRDEGLVESSLTVLLRNDAPTEGVRSHVIGPNAEGLEAGENRTAISVFCAPGCALDDAQRDGAAIEPLVEQEAGRPVYSFNMTVPSGGDGRAQLHYRTPDGWLFDEDGGVALYRLVVQEQNTIRPTMLDVEVELPEGMRVVRHSQGFEVSGGIARWSGEVRGDVVLEVELARPEGERLLGALRRLLGRELVRIGGD